MDARQNDGGLNFKAAQTRLAENLAVFDDEVAAELSSGGERADLWTDIDVNVEDLRVVLGAVSQSSVLSITSEALSDATDVLKAVHDWQAGSEILPTDLWTQVRDFLRKAGRI